MIISHKHKFIYLAPRRTGSSTIAGILEEHYDAEEFSFGLDYPRHEMSILKQWENYFMFVSVRNPYTRFASLYKFYYAPEHKQIDNTFDAYWNRYRIKSICDSLWEDEPLDGCARARVDAVVRLESIQSDFNALPFVDRSIQLPHWNHTKGSSLYGGHIQEKVMLYYAKDFIYFRYDPYDISMCELRYL